MNAQVPEDYFSSEALYRDLLESPSQVSLQKVIDWFVLLTRLNSGLLLVKHVLNLLGKVKGNFLEEVCV